MGLFSKPPAHRSFVSPAQPSPKGPARWAAPDDHSTLDHSKGEKSMANIGQSIVFKGELSGDEDLVIDGQVEGSVQLTNNELTVGANGHLKAEVQAKSIVVVGRVSGNLSASERIEIQATGIVDGDIKAPRLLIQEGAVLNGGIDMTSGGATAGKSVGSATTGTGAPSGGSQAAHQSA